MSVRFVCLLSHFIIADRVDCSAEDEVADEEVGPAGGMPPGMDLSALGGM
jgi:hypothetical protein